MMILDETRKEVQYVKSRFLSAKSTTLLRAWNVRTLSQTRKLTQLIRDFDNYMLYILGISEMRWKGSNKITKEGKTILYSGNEEIHRNSVGMILNNEASRTLMGWKPVNDRILTARFKNCHSKTNIIQVYAPTEEAAEEKDDFHNSLQDTLNEIPKHDIKILMGDMNAQISRDAFDQMIRPFGFSITY